MLGGVRENRQACARTHKREGIYLAGGVDDRKEPIEDRQHAHGQPVAIRCRPVQPPQELPQGGEGEHCALDDLEEEEADPKEALLHGGPEAGHGCLVVGCWCRAGGLCLCWGVGCWWCGADWRAGGRPGQ